MKEMPKSYDHQGVEDRLYEKWEKNGYFHAEPNPDKEPYCIVIPPPNITGQLHIGHAIDETLQDALIRYKRMAGFETLWLPGTDHASIATEVKIIEQTPVHRPPGPDAPGAPGRTCPAYPWRGGPAE